MSTELLHTVTLPDSGRQLTIRRIGPNSSGAIWRQVRADLAPPEPPTQKIDLGEGNIKHEPNPNDPAYLEQLATWRFEAQAEASRRTLRLIAQYAVLDPTDDAEVAAYKEQLRICSGVNLDQVDDAEYQFFVRSLASEEKARAASDRQVWIYHCLCVSERDAQALHDRVFSISRITPEAVQAHAESFPS